MRRAGAAGAEPRNTARPALGELLHFSEDPTITRFEPRVAATAQQPEAYVWAVNAAHSPSYWFPRQCPRAMAWHVERTTQDDADRILGVGGGERVHAIEYGWLDAMQSVLLYAYRMPEAPFREYGAAMVATAAVEPLGPPVPVGDLLTLHAAAGIQLRLLPNLWTFWDQVIESTVEFSGIRLRNALPRPE